MCNTLEALVLVRKPNDDILRGGDALENLLSFGRIIPVISLIRSSLLDRRNVRRCLRLAYVAKSSNGGAKHFQSPCKMHISDTVLIGLAKEFQYNVDSSWHVSMSRIMPVPHVLEHNMRKTIPLCIASSTTVITASITI